MSMKPGKINRNFLLYSVVFSVLFMITDFNANAACRAGYTISKSGLTVKFTDSSSTQNLAATKYYWSFGDGTYSTDKNPSHSFSKAGKYNVCHKVIDTANSCNNIICDSIEVGSVQTNCKAGYSISKSGLVVTLKNTSYTQNTAATRYTWSFGDGNYASSKDATHTYAKAGKYNLCLKVNDTANKCVNYFCDSVEVGGKPCNAVATWGYSALKGAVTFKPYATASGLVYIWSFGDGKSSYDKVPTHNYTSSGTYTVCLIVKDTVNKCDAKVCNNITVNLSGKKCNAQYFSKIVGRTIYVYAYDTTQSASSYFWYYSDGSATSTGKSASHTYSKGGKYTVCLRQVVGKDTCIECKVIVIPGCIANWGYKVDGKKLTVEGVYSATAKYYWNFGDGNTSTDRFTTHTYSSFGNYKVCLKVVDGKDSCEECKTMSIGQYTISGHVILAGSAKADCAKVWLIRYNEKDSSLYAVDSFIIPAKDSLRTYKFTNVTPGVYRVKAALMKCNSAYKKYIPTYFETALYWKSATYIKIYNAGRDNVDIKMIQGKNPGGPGFVGGKVKAGANKMEGDPMADVQVMLIDVNGDVADYTYSDENGDFSFDGIANGTYQVYAEINDIPTYPAYITITDNVSIINNIYIVVNTTSIVTGIKGIEAKANNSTLAVYPNPAGENLFVTLKNTQTTNATLKVYSMTGQVMTAENVIFTGNNTVTVNTSTLPAGIYMLDLRNNEGLNEKIRFMVSH